MRYFVYEPGFEKYGKTIETKSSFDARRIVGNAAGMDLSRLVAVREDSPSMETIWRKLA